MTTWKSDVQWSDTTGHATSIIVDLINLILIKTLSNWEFCSLIEIKPLKFWQYKNSIIFAN